MTLRAAFMLAAALAATLPVVGRAKSTMPSFSFPQGPKSYVCTVSVAPLSKAVVAEADEGLRCHLAHMPGQDISHLPKAELESRMSTVRSGM